FARPISKMLEQKASADPVLDAMAENFDLVVAFFPLPPEGLLSVDGGAGTLGFVVDFVADESKALRETAESLLRHAGAKVVIMGHTHEPQDHPTGINYVNTGSWTRYLGSCSPRFVSARPTRSGSKNGRPGRDLRSPNRGEQSGP